MTRMVFTALHKIASGLGDPNRWFSPGFNSIMDGRALPRTIGDWMLPRSKEALTFRDLRDANGQVVTMHDLEQKGYRRVTGGPGYGLLNRRPDASAPKVLDIPSAEQYEERYNMFMYPDYSDDVEARGVADIINPQKLDNNMTIQANQNSTYSLGSNDAYEHSLQYGRNQKILQDQTDRYNAMADANNSIPGRTKADRIKQKPIHQDTLHDSGAEEQGKNRFSHIKMHVTNPDGSHRYFTRNAQGKLEEVSLSPEDQRDYQQAFQNTVKQDEAYRQQQQKQQQQQQQVEPMQLPQRRLTNYNPSKVKYAQSRVRYA